MASVGKPRSYVIHSILLWSVVLNAKVKPTINLLKPAWLVLRWQFATAPNSRAGGGAPAVES